MPARPTPSARPLPRLLLLPLAAATLVLGLAGCAPEETDATPSAAPDATTSPTTPAAEPEASESPTPTPTPTGEPVSATCDEVLTLDQLYAFNPNYGTDPGYAPAGEPAVFAASIGGVACGLLNQSSGETIEISVARPVDATMEERLNAAVLYGQAVPTYGTPPEVEGYYGLVAGTGTAQVFAGGYWITASSDVFFEPGDPQPLMESMLANLVG